MGGYRTVFQALTKYLKYHLNAQRNVQILHLYKNVCHRNGKGIRKPMLDDAVIPYYHLDTTIFPLYFLIFT